MNLPNSFYEAILRGFAGDITARRALFLFVVDHSEVMQKPFGNTSQSRIDAVVHHLNEMIRDMAQVDNGSSTHLDIGLIGYGVQNAGSGVDTMWASDLMFPGNIIREIGAISSERNTEEVVKKPTQPDSDKHVLHALDVATITVASWTARNPNPILKPVVIHIVPTEKKEHPDIEAATSSLKHKLDAFLFHCCFDDRCSDSVVFPKPSDVPTGIAEQLYRLSSDMPPLMEDIGQLLKGHVTERFRSSAEGIAQSHGLPRGIGSLAADVLGRTLRPGGLNIPTGRFGWSRQVGASVDGLTIDSSKGFALIKNLIGLRIFTKLCN